jgi:pyrroline-5-carboxylate reductase
MVSGPDTIKQQRGIAAQFPKNNPLVQGILSALKFKVFPLAGEEELDAFTAFGPCLHVALTEWERSGRKANDAELIAAAQRFNLPDCEELLHWARSAQPVHLSANDLARYVAGAATPGGVTEAILLAIRAGQSLSSALAHGVEHSRRLRPQ